MKHVYKNIRKLNHSKLEISIQTEILDSVYQLTSLSCLAKTTSREKSYKCTIDLDKVDLKCADLISVSEFEFEYGDA